MSEILRTKTTVTVHPPTHTGMLVEKGVGYEWMVRAEERSTPTNTTRGIFHTRWHMGEGVPKLYYVPEPVPFVQVLHSHKQLPTFTSSPDALTLYDAAPRLGGSEVFNWDTALPNTGFLFRGASHRWGLTDTPCVSSGPFGSGATTLGATRQSVENFTIRVLPVLEYANGYFSMRVNINQQHFFWWSQEAGSRNGESYYGFRKYTNYATDQSKQLVPSGHLPIRAASNWLQFNFLAFGDDSLLIEALDHEGQALKRFMVYDPDLSVYGKDIEIELEVNNGILALGVTEHEYSATATPPASVPDEDASNDPADPADNLAMTYPLNANMQVANTSAPTGAAFGVLPPGTGFSVYAQQRAGTNLYRPVVALTSTLTQTSILFGAQLIWPTTLDPGTGESRTITDIRSAPTAYFAKDYRNNRLALDYAKGAQEHLKGNECVSVVVENHREDGTVDPPLNLFGGFVSSYGTSATGYDGEIIAHLEARDWTLRLDKKDMADTPSFAGWPLVNAALFVLNRCGVSDNLVHWEQSGSGWHIPQRAVFKLEFKYDETSTAVEALDGLLGSCGFTWGTGFNGEIYIWSRSADYVDYGAVIDETDTDDDNKIVRLDTDRTLDDFANEILLVTSALRDKTDPTTARVKNLNSQQDPADDLYVGEDWVRIRRYQDSYPAPLLAALELAQYTRDRRLCAFTPKRGRMDIQPRHIITASISNHDFASGTKFGIIATTYSIEEVGGLPRLRSEFVMAKI